MSPFSQGGLQLYLYGSLGNDRQGRYNGPDTAIVALQVVCPMTLESLIFSFRVEVRGTNDFLMLMECMLPPQTPVMPLPLAGGLVFLRIGTL